MKEMYQILVPIIWNYFSKAFFYSDYCKAIVKMVLNGLKASLYANFQTASPRKKKILAKPMYTSRPFQPPTLNQSNISWIVQIMKLSVIQLSLAHGMSSVS
jgi:hypothetical protein